MPIIFNLLLMADSIQSLTRKTQIIFIATDLILCSSNSSLYYDNKKKEGKLEDMMIYMGVFLNPGCFITLLI